MEPGRCVSANGLTDDGILLQPVANESTRDLLDHHIDGSVLVLIAEQGLLDDGQVGCE